MTRSITLAEASTIIDAALQYAIEHDLSPLTIAVLDVGGHIVAMKRSDGSGILRAEIAVAKAWGVLGMGWSAREMVRRAEEAPQFVSALEVLSGGRMLPAAGGIPIKDGCTGAVVGSVGVSGETPDLDETCGVSGIRAAGLEPWI